MGKTLDFKGTANRWEFFYFSILCLALIIGLPFLLYLIPMVLNLFVGMTKESVTKYVSAVDDMLPFLFLILSLVPFLAVSVRRMHAAGHSGLWCLLYFSPIFPVVYVYLLIAPNRCENDEYEKYEFVQKLIRQYEELFINTLKLDEKKAKSEVKKLFDIVEKEIQETGTGNLPYNLGALIAGNNTPEGPEAQDIFFNTLKRKARLINEGVKEKDIIYWWNLSQLERLMSIKVDEDIIFLSYLNKYGQSSLEKPPIEEYVKHNFPIYSYDEKETFEPDDPLPYELKKRIVSYINFEKDENEQVLNDNVSRFTSFNAYIRTQIQNKKL